MLSSQSTAANDFIAAFHLLAIGDQTTPFCSAREPSRSGALSGPARNPILVPSIAKSAGLNRFAYIVGLSEHRYVFSSIQKSQISLYSSAVFVLIGEDDLAPFWVGDYSAMITRLNSTRAGLSLRIYVHLLAEGELAKSHVISDLNRSVSKCDHLNYSAA